MAMGNNRAGIKICNSKYFLILCIQVKCSNNTEKSMQDKIINSGLNQASVFREPATSLMATDTKRLSTQSTPSQMNFITVFY